MKSVLEGHVDSRRVGGARGESDGDRGLSDFHLSRIYPRYTLRQRLNCTRIESSLKKVEKVNESYKLHALHDTAHGIATSDSSNAAEDFFVISAVQNRHFLSRFCRVLPPSIDRGRFPFQSVNIHEHPARSLPTFKAPRNL